MLCLGDHRWGGADCFDTVSVAYRKVGEGIDKEPRPLCPHSDWLPGCLWLCRLFHCERGLGERGLAYPFFITDTCFVPSALHSLAGKCRKAKLVSRVCSEVVHLGVHKGAWLSAFPLSSCSKLTRTGVLWNQSWNHRPGVWDEPENGAGPVLADQQTVAIRNNISQYIRL